MASAMSTLEPPEPSTAPVRWEPMVTELWLGGIERYNSRLEGYEAIVALELIEHLEPHLLSRFGVVTLGTYQPKLLLVSTPVRFSLLYSSPVLPSGVLRCMRWLFRLPSDTVPVRPADTCFRISTSTPSFPITVACTSTARNVALSTLPDAQSACSATRTTSAK